MKNQTRIGIVSWKNGDGSINVPNAYASFFSYFGTIVPIFALDDYINKDIDLLVLPGGADVNPERYGAKPNFECQNSNLQAEYFDTYVLPHYIDAGIPIFGICRGFQTLNVHFEGSLSQHIAQASSTLSRSQQVDSLLATEYGAEYMKTYDIPGISKGHSVGFKVNSLHHQGIFSQNLGNDVIPLLINSEHKNVEAFKIAELPIVGVQWHPEEIHDTFSVKTIRQLIKKSKRNNE